MATKTRERPKKLYICGLPFDIVNNENPNRTCEDVSTSYLDKQTINVMEDLPFPRWLSYVVGEIAVRLLEAAGYSGRTVRNAAVPFGPVLYRFIRENKFDWLHADNIKDPPPTVFINGMPYTITYDDAYLEVRHLYGEVCYTDLTIKVHSKLKAEAKAVVFLHEATHAMLYEARLINICGKESLVEPISYLMYQLFKQNDFSFAYNS
ncbi:MAG: hypothetical protein RSE04_05925 [Hydrogenoanaerobacterium sp.]